MFKPLVIHESNNKYYHFLYRVMYIPPTIPITRNWKIQLRYSSSIQRAINWILYTMTNFTSLQKNREEDEALTKYINSSNFNIIEFTLSIKFTSYSIQHTSLLNNTSKLNLSLVVDATWYAISRMKSHMMAGNETTK